MYYRPNIQLNVRYLTFYLAVYISNYAKLNNMTLNSTTFY